MRIKFLHIYKFLFLFAVSAIIMHNFKTDEVNARLPFLYIIPDSLEVEMFALNANGSIRQDITDAECRNNNPLTRNAYGCGTTNFAYPHPTNIMTINLENDYLPFVIAQEMGYDALLPAYEAHAVAARSYALHLFEFASLNNSSQNQVFTPYSITPSADHYQAVNNTAGIIMVCNNDTDCEAQRKGFPIFAEHSAGHDGNFTVAWPWGTVIKHAYLARVYDAIHTTANGGHGHGMSQNGAKNWAAGVGENDDPFPPWDYRRILAHYYTNVEFEGLIDTPPNDYRFNILEFGNMDDRNDGNPLILRKGRKYHYPFIIQNTGHNDWNLYCNGSDYNVALGLHWYSYPSKQFIPDTFEGSRTALCPSYGTLSLAPGEEFPPQDSGSNTLNATIWVDENLATDGDYWLRLDVEFRDVSIWGSRLHPQNNPNNALWPTQDIHVLIAPQSVSPPRPMLDNHTPGEWNNLPEVAVSWPSVDDTMGIDRYEYRWNSESWQSTNNTTASKTLSNGQHRFRVVAIANDGEESDTATINDILIDTILPIASLTALPEKVTTPSYSLTWSSGDSGGSGLQENQLRYQINGGAWSTVSGISDPSIQSIQFDFPGGQHGDIYTFCLKTLDNADNESLESCDTTRYSPDPEFDITPLIIRRLKVYSDATPLVETLRIQNIGGNALNWTATQPTTWTLLSAITGTAPSTVQITVTHPLTAGTYTNIITFTGADNTHNSPQIVTITVQAVEQLSKVYLPLILR